MNDTETQLIEWLASDFAGIEKVELDTPHDGEYGYTKFERRIADRLIRNGYLRWNDADRLEVVKK